MIEENSNEKQSRLLEGLGPHFHAAVAQHVQNHEQQSVGVERRARLAALAKRLQQITNDERYARADKTEPKHVETLESGTRVDAYLKTRGSLKTTIEIMTNEVRDDGGRDYLEQGPLSVRAQDPSNSINLAEFVNHEQGLGVLVALETPHSFGDTKTTDSVLVGRIIDPESIIVPELSENPEDTTGLYSVIGPEDPRFNAIMDMVDHIANGTNEAAAHIPPSSAQST